jgi:hypothetical protein
MTKRLIALLLFAAAFASAQTNPVTAAYPGAVVTDDQLTYQDDFGSTTLSSSVGASDLTVFITSATGFVEPSVIAVCPLGECSAGNYANAELMRVVGISGTTLTIDSTGRALGPDCIGSATGLTFANGSAVELVPSACAHNRLAAEVLAIQTALGANLSLITELTDIDTEAELEAILTDVTNLIVSTEIDSVGELEALAAAVNLIQETEIDTEAELEALLAAVNVILATEIDTSAEVAGILGDESGTGLVVFNVAPNLQGVIDGTGTAVDDDDCTGQQGEYWYDSTDGRFEFCNANSGVPGVPGGVASTEINDLEGAAPTAILTTEILIGTGSGTAAFAALSGDATMANTGAVTVVDDLHAHTGASISALDTADITTGTLANARVAAGNVTQHVGAIDHNSLLNFSATKHIDHASSATSAFIQDGGVTALTCGASNQGRMQILDDGTLQVCDGATTSLLKTFVSGAHTTEVNDLEGTAPTAILTTEIPIGTGAGTLAFAALSGDATMSNTGAVTLAATITRDTEWDTLAEINAATTDDDAAGLAATNAFTGTPTFSNATYSALFTGGNVGIGTATPGAALQVVSTTSADQLRVGYDTTNYYKIGRNSADGVLHFQGTQATYNGYNFLSQAGTSSFFIKDSGSVGIGTAAPNASALLDLTSTTGALMLPRMTTTQRDALTAANGMLIYNTTLNKFQGYEGGAWASLI